MGLKTSKDGHECCKLMFMHNGELVTKRLYAMEVQSAIGRFYTIRDEALPEVIILTAKKEGLGYLAQVLLHPRDSSLWSYKAPRTNDFPRFRDLVMMAIGVMSFHFALALIDGLANTF